MDGDGGDVGGAAVDCGPAVPAVDGPVIELRPADEGAPVTLGRGFAGEARIVRPAAGAAGPTEED